MDLKLYGLADLEDVGHDACDIGAFCRNPLHPGPCKGWKHSLRAIAPGVHKAIEDERIARVHRRRAERRASHEAAGTKAPRERKMAHERAPRKTGPRDGDGDGKLREGEDEPAGGKRVRKGEPPTKLRGAKTKQDVRSTRTDDGKGDNVDKPEAKVEPLKGYAQRDSLRAIVSTGTAGYQNRNGYVTKATRDKLVAKGLIEIRDDGRWYATDHGRAVHEASIPRRNGEEIGFDGKTASERAAEEEAAKGEERRRIRAEAEAQFQRGIPAVAPRGSEILATPGAQRVRNSMNRVAQALSKDLGETAPDFAEDIGPAARAWRDRSLEAEEVGSEWRQQRARSAWLRSAAKADPSRAADYERMADDTDAASVETDKRWDAAVDAANAARDALGDAVVARYKAKGRRKTAAALKLATSTKDTEPTGGGTDTQRATIDAEVDRRDRGLAALADGLTPEQAERGRKAGEAYTAAVVEDLKANTELDAARYEASVAHSYVTQAERVPSMLRNEPKYAQEREEAKARAAIADRRERAARDRADVTKEQKRRAAVQFQRAADDLTDEKNQALYDERLARVTREQAERRAAHQRELDAQVDEVRRPMPDKAEPFDAQVDKVAEIARTVKGFREFLNRPPYVIHDGEGSGDTAIYTGSTSQEVVRGSAPPPERVLNYSPKRGGGWRASNGLPLDDADVPYYIAEWNARGRNDRNPNDLVGLAKFRRQAAEKAAGQRAGADTMPA